MIEQPAATRQPLVSPIQSLEDLSKTESTSRTARLAPPFDDEDRAGGISSATSADGFSSPDASDDEDNYHTKFTTPATSESSPEDMECQEVEDFRDREYPQLKGQIQQTPLTKPAY